MNNSDLKWYIIKNEYVEYLKNFDDKVQNIKYDKSSKTYVGIVFSINKIDYYVPISSPKSKYKKMKETIDFFYDKLSNYFYFKDEKNKYKYIKLLEKEINIINLKKDDLLKRAKRLYDIRNKFPNSNISLRCCNFKLLEEKCIEYKR